MGVGLGRNGCSLPARYIEVYLHTVLLIRYTHVHSTLPLVRTLNNAMQCFALLKSLGHLLP